MKMEGIQELLRMISSNKTYPDSVLLQAYNTMNTGISFIYNRGSYEAIKSVGLNKIANDSLRKTLIRTYEEDMPRINKIIDYIQEDPTNKEYKLQLHNALWKRVQIQLPNQRIKLVSRPINSEQFLKQPELIDRIKIEQDNMNMFNYWMSGFERSIENCLNAIDQELSKE